jgi:hypothetical protein
MVAAEWARSGKMPPKDRYLLSAHTRAASERGHVLELTSDTMRSLLEGTKKLAFPEQETMVLDYIESHTDPGKTIRVSSQLDYPIAFTDPEGLQFILREMGASDLIKRVDRGNTFQYQLTGRGHERLAQIRKARTKAPAEDWPRVRRTLDEMRKALDEAENAEQFQAVGLLGRDLLISLAKEVYDPERHPSDTQLSDSDAEGMLNAFFAATLGGSENAKARRLAKAAEVFANGLAHNRGANHRDGLTCLESVSFLVTLVEIIAGKRDR